MANRRMLSKSVSTSTKLSEVSNFAKLLFTWTIPHCDDFGHLDATPKIVKGIVVPLCDETVDMVSSALLELEKAGLITFYEMEGRRYLEIVKWEEHQTFKTDRPKVQLFPHKTRKPVVSRRKPTSSNVPRKLSEVKLSEVNLSEESGAPSPKEIAIDFFSQVEFLKAGDEEKSKSLVAQINELMAKHGAPYELLLKEILKFTSYWTEKNKSGTKQRWEMEQTFEVSRRLANWFSKIGEFQRSKGRPLVT